ncbi:MAG: CDP-alcohol phosphatidyltransferase family protein [Myxococcales bacterium]|nr:CDP-alcohol phosphatidyltransferase family protein [Myxococcales bacterium]
MNHDQVHTTAIARRSRRRHVADALSFGNLLCGLSAMAAAVAGRLDTMLALILLGWAFDGLDGLAARRWGGTRFGVYADDVADAITYGLAPGVAIALLLGGGAGLLLGGSYALFTWSRLLYFTLTKDAAEAGSFGGVPSAVAAVLVASALLLFGKEPVYVGAAVGAACTLMVAFPMRYSHLSRVLGVRKRRPLLVILAVTASAATLFAGPHGLAIVLFSAALAYGLWPSVKALRQAMTRVAAR